MSASKNLIAAEFARRAKKFEKIEDIRLWGLFNWGDISRLVKSGEIIPNDGYGKENRVIWCKPSKGFYDKYVHPLMSLPIKDIEEILGIPS